MHSSRFIPVANPAAQFKSHEKEIRSAIERCLESGRYILGPEVERFEQEFAALIGTEFCTGVANGTDALALALRAAGVGAGDEVITVSHSAVATVAAIEQAGAVPVFADIDPTTRCLNPAVIEPLISPHTKAVVVVHVYGQPAAIQEIVNIAHRHRLKVVEDCAQALGAEVRGRKVGAWGDVATFSFYPTKNVGALGDGGAVVTNSIEIAERVQLLREYGWKERYVSSVPGFNSRLDEFQAAILRAKLPFLERENTRRRQIAASYRNAISGTEIRAPQEIRGTVHAMHLFVLESDRRNDLSEYLHSARIGTALHYPQPIHTQPAYTGRIRGSDRLPNTEALYQRILTLPMFPELTDTEVDWICHALCAWTPQI